MTRHNPDRRALLLGVLLLSLSAPASADAGVPMIFITLPAMLIALIPVIAVETAVLVRALRIPLKRCIAVTTAANLASTLIGMPLTWIALVFIQLISGGGAGFGLSTPLQRFLAVTWQAPWLIPYDSEMYWMVPVATLVLMIPFFFMSWWSEYLVARWILKDADRTALRRAIRNANLLSYALLALVVLALLLGASPPKP